MDASRARVRNSVIYVESTDTPLPESATEAGGEFGTTKTNAKLTDAYAQLKELLQDVSSTWASPWRRQPRTDSPPSPSSSRWRSPERPTSGCSRPAVRDP